MICQILIISSLTEHKLPRWMACFSMMPNQTSTISAGGPGGWGEVDGDPRVVSDRCRRLARDRHASTGPGRGPVEAMPRGKGGFWVRLRFLPSDRAHSAPR